MGSWDEDIFQNVKVSCRCGDLGVLVYIHVMIYPSMELFNVVQSTPICSSVLSDD
jgi:hypothetical protein